jgi:excinuclease UvrABC nuclease subunit
LSIKKVPDTLFPYQNPLPERLGVDFFKQIPRLPGVYVMYGLSNHVIYVGKAKDLRARLASYRRARPHQVARKVVRLIHSIDEIRYEICESEAHALLRENELLRQHKPLFNVVNTHPESYYFIGVRERESDVIPAIEFRLTTNPDFGPDWEHDSFFGAFKGRNRIREGYQALLRILWATQSEDERFEFPTCLTRRKVPYAYEFRLKNGTSPRQRREWLALVRRFLKGTSDELLKHATQELLSNSRIPPFYYRVIQDDLELLRDFYQLGPARNRKLRAALGLSDPLIAQERIDDLLVLYKAKTKQRF